MKVFIKSIIVLGLFVFTACNSSKNKPGQDNLSKQQDTVNKTVADDSSVKTVTPVFPHSDPKVTLLITSITDHYLHIKNALAGDKHDEAAAEAKVLSDVLNNADKSVFSAAEKAVYEQLEANLKEDAEHISKSPEIKHQRYHFITLSTGVSALVKNFGEGKTLYVDHCPMANDGKGADWVSEIPEIKNPYLGTEMPTCGILLEKIK